jgi:hypothetical protein
MKYIFMAGAPGSKWSSVSKNIYFSPSIDRSDASPAREYWHSAWGEPHLMHMGAYFDPGMEFGGFFDRLNEYSKEECEAEFDRPFSGEGVRIVKSHVFAHHIDFLKQHWPDCPIVLVHRSDDACLGWWVKCGHFNITYPTYNEYYVDLKNMARIIADQNKDILATWKDSHYIGDNLTLARTLRIEPPPMEYYQSYKKSDIEVTVI